MPFKTVKATIVSTTALLMHNGQLSDPLNEIAIEMKKLNDSKRGKKTEADHVRLAELEFTGGLWLDTQYGGKKGEPVVPADAIEAMLQRAGSVVKQRGGKRDFATGVRVIADYFPLLYKGPRTAEGLWGDGFRGDKPSPFIFRKSVTNQNARIIRTRPRFDAWKLELEFEFDDHTVQANVVKEALERAGDVVGIGDWRPSSKTPGKYGRFTVEEFKVLK